MSNEFNPLVSFYPNAYENLPTEIEAAKFIADIKGGTYAGLVRDIRQRFQTARKRGVPYEDAKKAVDSLKKKLGAVTLAGIQSMRGNKFTPQFTGLIQADFDLLGDKLEYYRELLADDPHIYALFVSATGEGLKAFCRIPFCKNADEYKFAFDTLARHVKSFSGCEIDKLKEVARLCYASHDPQLYHNPQADELPVDFAQMPEPEPEKKPSQPAKTTSSTSISGESRRTIAERVTGPVQWESDVLGYCDCPGKSEHTNGDAPKDCRVTLDAVPTVFCLHKSCVGSVDAANHELRSLIGKAEFVPTQRLSRPPNPAPTADSDSPPDSIYDEYIGQTEVADVEQGEAGEKKNGFTIRTPDEILGMVFCDDDIILGDRIMAEAQPCVIAAAGGMGKSRIVLQLLACVTTGRKFLNFVTGKPESIWLVLQTENSNRRLHDDLKRLKLWLGDDWPKFAARVRFHTIENDTDGFVNLDSPEAVANIQSAILLHKADNIVVDPLNDFSIGDPSKDSDMKMTVQALARVCRKGNPKRAILVLHHAITGRAGASKATGFDRASFGRNSKALFAWTRAQINLAPVDADSNERLIVACGKCSNGREFQTFAVRLNPETMIYEVDPTVDVSQWEQDITGAKDTTPLMNPDRVRELCATAGSSKAELAKAVMDDCGCYRGSAYRYITRAERGKKISFNKSHETYFRK